MWPPACWLACLVRLLYSNTRNGSMSVFAHLLCRQFIPIYRIVDNWTEVGTYEHVDLHQLLPASTASIRRPHDCRVCTVQISLANYEMVQFRSQSFTMKTSSLLNSIFLPTLQMTRGRTSGKTPNARRALPRIYMWSEHVAILHAFQDQTHCVRCVIVALRVCAFWPFG